RYAVQAQLDERQGRLAGLKADLATVPDQIGLYRDLDNTANAKLSDLKVQRDSLIARYQPGAAPVRALDAQIAELQGAIASGQVQGPGAQRQGINPVYQTLRTEELQMAAEAEALKSNLAALDRQSAEITDRSLHLSALDPKFQELERQREVLRTNVKDFTAREDESRAAQEISAQTNDNIRIVERASVPTQAKSLRKPILILAFLFAAFSALCAGLLRLYTRPGLPTAASAARTLELPVLGAAALKA
ncbi:MAG: GumC family protein, partial [Caulobacteraceae bacterium]